MSKWKPFVGPLYFCLLLPALVTCLYKDQVDKFDWINTYIGKLKFAEFDSVKRVVIATEENVVASLHLKTGLIAWRQVLEDPATNSIAFMNVNKVITTVSGNSNLYYVRGWDVSSGHLAYEWTIQPENKNTAYWFMHNDDLIHVVPILGSHLEVTVYKEQTGENRGFTSKIATPWVTDLTKCAISKTMFACISSDDSTGNLYYINLASNANKVYNHKLEHLIGAPQGKVELSETKYSEPAILLTRNSVSRLVVLSEDRPNVLPFSLNSNVISIQNGDVSLLVETKQSSEKHLSIRTLQVETSTEENIETELNKNYGNIQLVSGICRGTACRLLLTSDQNDIILLQLPGGQFQWHRDEALASIVTTHFIELPISEMDASIKTEFASDSNDIVGMFVNRIVNQIRQVSSVFSGTQQQSDGALVRDEFGLQKLIILATKSGKLYGVDSRTGSVVWVKFLKNIAPFSTLGKDNIILKEQRTTRYAPLPGVVTLIAKDPISGKGVLYTFNPMTGESEFGIQRLSYNIKQVLLLPHDDTEHLNGLVVQSEDDKLHVYPEQTQKVLAQHAKSLFMYSANLQKGAITGYSLAHSTSDMVASPVWEFQVKPSELLGISMRPIHERVHSQGRVLADRSVLYKYINPNLLAIATITNDTLHKHVLSVYIIDGITGFVVYSASHKRATGPVSLVHSENWLAYTYFNERFRRVELASVELYEGAIQSNSTAFSSHAVSSIPLAESQAYILPANPLAIASTLTERGITSKHLLFGLTSGAVIEVPWAFMEPRSAQTTGSPEEGYIPYMPELPLPSEATINYYKSVERIRDISVTPARLESTSLVFVHGLDHFCTRVSPSKQFDVLKEDFDHWLIIMVLVALTVASYFTKELASRKALKQAWK